MIYFLECGGGRLTKYGGKSEEDEEQNTSSDEDFPNLSPDGQTLYFSSKGHTSMGGYDIFTANWDESKKKPTVEPLKPLKPLKISSRG